MFPVYIDERKLKNHTACCLQYHRILICEHVCLIRRRQRVHTAAYRTFVIFPISLKNRPSLASKFSPFAYFVSIITICCMFLRQGPSSETSTLLTAAKSNKNTSLWKSKAGS
jgi:hypothetical protein